MRWPWSRDDGVSPTVRRLQKEERHEHRGEHDWPESPSQRKRRRREWSSGTLEYLGRVPPIADVPTCQVCHAPATLYKKVTQPERYQTDYHPITFTCDEHESYMDNHCWGTDLDGKMTDYGVSIGECCRCHAPYGSCHHTATYAAEMRQMEDGAERGRL